MRGYASSQGRQRATARGLLGNDEAWLGAGSGDGDEPKSRSIPDFLPALGPDALSLLVQFNIRAPMALDRINLRTLLRMFALRPERRAAAVRADALTYVRKQIYGSSPGGDFHSCFWADAKAHAAGRSDLQHTTDGRIADYAARERLYKALRDGFLDWWDNNRRWINEPIAVMDEQITAPYRFVELEGVVKVENLLALKIGGERERLIYPYFSEAPVLDDLTARLGLWLLIQALPDRDPESLRILDVLRGMPFSLERNPLNGDEGAIFVERYARMLSDWRRIVHERLSR